ncbi:1-(5-phosphoribosyl)-5-[(5-phosphoribosylamino)methylideneamino]imidazole-4-carboxamide isomerase [Deinococcus petrolearius]|uniref:1-(5-phosphoribosyl)-5-[(5-phosphoribosylamino)methylideneamino] imidazole-4-carboxamide isomerase n=1 Tax=Deinococcus petrolearius TaxID=1751295 RepID=A0ABW1DLK3_9DEIO
MLGRVNRSATPLILPCVDIQSGRAVRLYEGDPERETVYFESPLDAARHWTGLGADFVHLVDLDAATGRGENREIIAQIVTELSGSGLDVPVEVGGGVRRREDAEALLALGVRRVVIGTAAVKNPELVAELIAAHGPGAVVVSLDARGLEIATHGWAQGSGIGVGELTPRLADAGLETLIFTDVTRDGTLKGLDRELMRQVRGLWPGTLIVGGGVRDVQDIRLLAEEGIEGAIVGRAIYEGTLPYPVTL